jgi:hypothetical protein
MLEPFFAAASKNEAYFVSVQNRLKIIGSLTTIEIRETHFMFEWKCPTLIMYGNGLPMNLIKKVKDINLLLPHKRFTFQSIIPQNGGLDKP